MPYAVELYLEGRAEAAVRVLWEALRDAGLGARLSELGALPHLTLAVYEEDPQEPLRDQLASFFAAEEPLEITLATAGAFPGEEGAVFLGPVVTPALLDLHERFHRRFDHLSAGAWAYYRPSAWVPHVTIAEGLARRDVGRAVDLALDGHLPIQALLARAGVVAFDRELTRPLRHLFDAPLRA
jgi:2'-5' RNA ligase